MAEQQIVRIVQSPESWLRPFHGESRDLERFKDDIRTALAAADLPEIADRVRLVTRHLSSSVRDSIECYPAEERRTPDEILQLLSKIYGEHRSVTELLRNLHETRQRPAESISEFSIRLNRAYLALTKRQADVKQPVLPRAVLADLFTEGIRDTSLQMHLKASNLQELIPLREMAEKLSTGPLATVSATSSHTHTPPPSHPQTHLHAPLHPSALTEESPSFQQMKRQMEEMQNEIRDMKKMKDDIRDIKNLMMARQSSTERQGDDQRLSQRDPQPSRRCFTCSSPSHFARNCPQRRTASGNASHQQ